jgi:SSS family solute:Na+ symporter
MMLKHYYSTGLLGIGFTALMASFMSGLAGNVTAFNTVWTYDIYQSYLARNRSDRHYLWVGRVATVCGILLSMAAAYLASRFDNIMDLIQLVAGFVNAPLFATFLLGMFWKRATGHGAFAGLVGGTLGAALLHGLSLAEGATAGIKGGWLAAPLHFHSAMGQNFCIATVSWTCCFALTILVSLATRRNKSDAELSGLVYSLTSRLAADREPWHRRPAVLGGIVLVAMLVLNYFFR